MLIDDSSFLNMYLLGEIRMWWLKNFKIINCSRKFYTCVNLCSGSLVVPPTLGQIRSMDQRSGDWKSLAGVGGEDGDQEKTRHGLGIMDVDGWYPPTCSTRTGSHGCRGPEAAARTRKQVKTKSKCWAAVVEGSRVHVNSQENSVRGPVVFQLALIPALSSERFKCTKLQPWRDFLRRRKIFSSLSNEVVKPRRIRMNMEQFLES